MQVFLPKMDYYESAKCLDLVRLGNQIKENGQILRGAFLNHPISQLWKNYREELLSYTLILHAEWLSRGREIHGSMFRIMEENVFFDFSYPQDYTKFPKWLTPEICSKYRSHLLAKATLKLRTWEWYSKFPWIETPKLLTAVDYREWLLSEKALNKS